MDDFDGYKSSDATKLMEMMVGAVMIGIVGLAAAGAFVLFTGAA